MNERIDTREDDASDLPYNGDVAADPLHPDLEDRDRTPNSWDLDESEFFPFTEASHSGEIIYSSPSISHELDGDDDSQKGLIQRHEGHLVGKQEPASATARSTMDASLYDPSYVPQSYRSAIIGKTIMGSSPTEFTQSASALTPSSRSSSSTPSSRSSAPTPSSRSSAPTPSSRSSASTPSSRSSAPTPSSRSSSSTPSSRSSASTPSSRSSSSTPSSQLSATSTESFISSIYALFPPPSASRKERFSGSGSGLSFGSVKPEASQTEPQSIASTNTEICSSNHLSEPVSTTSLHQSPPGSMDDFPHLDIIHELLDEEENTNYGSNHSPLLFRLQSVNGRHSISSDSANSELNFWDHKTRRLNQTEQLYYGNGFSGIHGGSSNRPRERFQDWHFDPSTTYGFSHSLWHYNPAELSVINLGDGDGSTGGGGGGGGLYSYHCIPYYTDTGRGLNGYGPYW